MIRYYSIISFFLLVILISCKTDKKRWHIQVDPVVLNEEKSSIHRYEKALFGLNPENLRKGLESISDEYGIFLGPAYTDTLQLLQMYNYITDPLLIELYYEVEKRYPDLEFLENRLKEVWAYFHHYFPGEEIPTTYSYVSGLDFSMPVIYSDTAMIIALDLYLGAGFKPYREAGLPSYRIQRCSKEYIIRDCCYAIAGRMMQGTTPGTSLLDYMIHEGKKIYFLDMLMPSEKEAVKIGFTESHMEWCRKNESNLWKFIIENNYLYSGDVQVINRFITDGPFTKGFPDSPSRLGVWIGWQIVRSYMNRHENVSFKDLVTNTDSQEILTKSGYKPGIRR